MYFTTLPDHSQANFNEEAHFSRFKKHNIIFNSISNSSYCDDHVGCLSFKTILKGEECYVVNRRRIVVRPGQFLVLNNEQNYSCSIDQEQVRGFSVFFQQDFAAEVFRNEKNTENMLLDDPFPTTSVTPEFFQTLKQISPELQLQLTTFISSLEHEGFHGMTNEKLVRLLEYLIRSLQGDTKYAGRVAAVKLSSRIEIYKRLCIARDILHSTYMDDPDLHTLGIAACMSIPQLIRQFKLVFKITPHQYLVSLRLQHAQELLKFSNKPIHEITWLCGFANVSAFCRAFKIAYGRPPQTFRKSAL